jgi:hypothetical protein
LSGRFPPRPSFAGGSERFPEQPDHGHPYCWCLFLLDLRRSLVVVLKERCRSRPVYLPCVIPCWRLEIKVKLFVTGPTTCLASPPPPTSPRPSISLGCALKIINALKAVTASGPAKPHFAQVPSTEAECSPTVSSVRCCSAKLATNCSHSPPTNPAISSEKPYLKPTMASSSPKPISPSTAASSEASRSRPESHSPPRRNPSLRISNMPSAASQHRQSFNELRGAPPSPRSQRQPSISQLAVQDLIDNPPHRSAPDPRFAGRDWRTIKILELTSPEDLRFVETDTPVEAATNVSALTL